MRATKLYEESGLKSVLVSVVRASYVQEWVWCLTTPPIFSACGQFKFKCIDWKCKLFLDRRGEQVGCESAFRMFVECGRPPGRQVFLWRHSIRGRAHFKDADERTWAMDAAKSQNGKALARAVASRQCEVTVRIAWKVNHP